MSVRQEFLPIFPQRLDLCQISPKKSEKKSKKKKIPSPIKKTNDTKLSILSEKSEIRSEKHKNKCKSADLDAMEKNFKELLENFSVRGEKWRFSTQKFRFFRKMPLSATV